MKVFQHEIDPYLINVSGFELRVVPIRDGACRDFNQKKVIADLYPEITAARISFNSFGQLSIRPVEEIGSQIDAHEV